MNLSEQISFLFSCNVSPSDMPQLDISVTKSEPLTIAVPMTIFYSIIFLFGVWLFSLLDPLYHLIMTAVKYDKATAKKSQWYPDSRQYNFSHCKTTKCSPWMLSRFYSMAWAYWPSSWMLTWESALSGSTCSVWLYQVCITTISSRMEV